ncbi:MAG TPA: XcyI family restriction endonuclease [Deltaproteobacteria bacterium]|nr:XcyI family restriction endonuclease [Deltaproteobacteria bacterium]
MAETNQYTEDLRLIKSLLIVTSLQKRRDLHALKLIKKFAGKLRWKPYSNLLIDPEIWKYAVKTQGYDPKLVFCHPEVLLYEPTTSLYYRGLCGLSLKAVRDYFGAVDSLEAGNPRARLDNEKALKMARTYNAFICSIIKNSSDWTLENGNRTIIATLGITLDGVMRNKIGDIAEERIRGLVVEWLAERNLIIEPVPSKLKKLESTPSYLTLKKDILMRFSPEPDISFLKDDQLLAVIEIKGGIDPAGALERYGAAKKSFEHAIGVSPMCKNFYLGGVFTEELTKRISSDRLVEKTFNVIEILDKPKIRKEFFDEIFHHTLRLI